MLAMNEYSAPARGNGGQSGYSLIQIAIAMLVIGLLAAPFGNLYILKKKDDAVEASQTNLSAITNAIRNYKSVYGVYPCPAPMAVPRFSSAYGHVVEHTDPNACRGAAIAAIAPGHCGVGVDSVCVEKTLRTTPPLAPPADRVIVGAVPFRLLQVNEKETVDGYGSKFVYAVTQSLTDTATFDETKGAIAIQDGTGQSLTSPLGSASFIVISPGPDKVGGYTIDGKLQKPCAGAGLDVENCNVGFETTSAASPNSLYDSALENDAQTGQHFDDLVNYYTQDVDPLWRRALSNPENIEDIASGAVGVGVATPSSAVQLDISSISAPGNLPSIGIVGTDGSDGVLFTSALCGMDGTNCFSPRNIMGFNSASNPAVQGDGMKCAPGFYMSGIENGIAKCIPSSDLSIICPASTPVLTGINTVMSGGVPTYTPICKNTPNPGCAAQSVSVCSGGDGSLTAASDGDTQIVNAGACMTAYYTCYSGTWAEDSSDGLCTFTAPPPVVTTGIACSTPGYTGTYTRTETQNCDGSTTTVTTEATDCVCTGGTTTESRICAWITGFENYTGNATQTTTYTPPSCTPVTGPWDTSGCVCTVPAVTTRTVSVGTCPSGMIGDITQAQTFDTGSCSWKDTGSVVNSCVCDVPPVTTRTISVGSCPSGYTGTVTQNQTYNTTTCAWDDSGPVNSSCICDTTPVNKSQDAVCSDPVCQQPSSTDQDIFQTTFDPVTCDPTTTKTHSGSCVNKAFVWTQYGAPIGSGTPPSSPTNIGTSCTCADFKAGTPRFCYVAGDLSYTQYTCKCQ